MTDFNIDDYLNDRDKWAVPNPDYLGAVMAAVGGAPCVVNRADCARNLLNLCAHSPVALVYIHSGDPGNVQVCHSLARFPAVIGTPTALDNLVVGLQGRSCDDSVPTVFPEIAFQRADIRCLRLPEIVGVAGFGAAVPVLHTGPHGIGVADTDELNVRKVLIIPPVAAGTTVELAPEGTYTYQGFYNTILNVGLSHADPGVQALWVPVRDWFLYAVGRCWQSRCHCDHSSPHHAGTELPTQCIHGPSQASTQDSERCRRPGTHQQCLPSRSSRPPSDHGH